jgi:anthranilate phosphoribosyltransferase
VPQALPATLERLLEHRHLTESEADELLVALTDPELAPALAGAILVALRSKGVTPDEVRGFARAMRRLARRPQLAAGAPLVDVVGTGGDASGSLNLSTGTALLAAACGVRIAKHGNRSISSRSGSADLLAALGLTLPLDESAAGRCLEATGFTFFFAPHYHPALKALAPVRGALGVRTVFNMLGPLTNPAEPPYHLIGAYSLSAAELMANTLAGMRIERAFVVHGEPGWDEPTPIGPFTLFDVRPGNVQRSMRDASHFGLPPCRAEELAGGDAEFNAAAIRAVFGQRDRGAHRSALLLGAALVLELSGREPDTRKGVEHAAGAIDSGRAAVLLEKLAAFEVSPR